MASFSGRYDGAVDPKGRLYVPAPFRKALPPEANDTFMVTLWYDGCLAVYDLDYWYSIVVKQLRSLSSHDEKKRRFVRLVVSEVQECKVDKQGRINIPQWLLEGAKITDKVIITGVLDRLEVWDPQRYEEYKRKGPDQAELAEELNLSELF